MSIRNQALLISLLLALLFGVASLWELWEQDIFWQVRAGDELLRTGHFPRVDSWSYTASGDPWYNLLWLSTVLVRVAYALGAEPALVLFRGLCVLLLFLLLARVVVRVTAEESWRFALLVLMPILFTSFMFRLQIRPDTFVFLTFAGIVAVWLEAWPLRRRLVVTLVLVWLSANLHVGTAPFVLVLAAGFVVSAPLPRRARLGWTIALGLAFFATPYHVRVLSHLYDHLFYFSHKVMRNPDHQALAGHHLDPARFGWQAWSWLVLQLMALGGFVVARRRPENHPALFTRWYLFLPVFLLFGALSFNRIRAFPYSAIFAIPVAALALERALAAGSRKALTAVAIVVSLGFGGHNYFSRPPGWGIRISARTFPIGSVAFLHRTRPEPRLYNTFAFGNYLLWHLPEYKVFGDTRETPYWKLEKDVLDAFSSATVTRRIYDRYGINISLVPIPKTAYRPPLGFVDVISDYLPKQDWALVYFDAISVVVVRRIPEHAALIEEYEYRILKPNLPPNLYVHSSGRTPSSDARFEQELARCLSLEPDNLYCHLGRVAWWRKQARVDRYPEALKLLEKFHQAQRGHPTLGIYLLLELQGLYEATGRIAQAERIKRLLEGKR